MKISIRHAALLLGFIGVLVYVALVLPARHWTSSITAAFPDTEHSWQQQLLQHNKASQQIRLLLLSDSHTEVQNAANLLLKQNVKGLDWQKPGAMFQQIQQAYQQHQGQIVRAEDKQLLLSGSSAELVTLAWQRLLSPAPLFDNALQQDPLLFTQRFVEQFADQQKLQVNERWLQGQIEGKQLILLHAELSFDPFDSELATISLAQLEQVLTEIKQQWPDVEVARSGVIFHASAAAANAAFEMSFYGGLSMLAIVLLFLLVFRSLKPLLLAVLVLSVAVSCGLAALLFFFPQPHILSLVFATTLIGIAIDYSFHGMLAADRGKDFFRSMLPSLTLSLLSTVLGYLLLVWLPLTILNQVAVFICVGLTAAYFTVRLLFPLLLKERQTPVNAFVLSACKAVARIFASVSAKAAFIVLALAALTAVFVLGSTQSFSDNVRLFTQSPAELMQQEQRVQTASGQGWDSRFLVLIASSDQELLEKEQQLNPLLQSWKIQGQIERWQALSDFVSPVKEQKELAELQNKIYQSAPVQAYLAELQLSVPQVKQSVLEPADLHALAEQHLVDLTGKKASVIFLSAVKDPLLLKQQLQQQPKYTDVYWFDPLADASASIEKVRHQLMLWFALAFCAISLVLLWKYGVADAVAIVLYLSLAVGGGLSIGILVQQQLTIFHLVGALLVVALALDYAVFFASELDKAEVTLAVLLSALTSGFAFGVLSFSQTPAISAFGLTVFSGIVLATLSVPFIGSIRSTNRD